MFLGRAALRVPVCLTSTTPSLQGPGPESLLVKFSPPYLETSPRVCPLAPSPSCLSLNISFSIIMVPLRSERASYSLLRLPLLQVVGLSLGSIIMCWALKKETAFVVTTSRLTLGVVLLSMAALLLALVSRTWTVVDIVRWIRHCLSEQKQQIG